MMHQKVYRIAIVLFIIFLIVNMFYYMTSTLNYPVAPLDIDPYRVQTCPHTRLYFVDQGRLRYELIELESSRSAELDELLRRYQAQSADHVEPLDVIELYEEQDRIVLDLRANPFQNAKYHEKNITSYVMSLVNTLTERQPQKPVQFMFEGNLLKNTLHGLDLRRPIARDESLVYTGEEDIRNFFEMFLMEVATADDSNVACMLSFRESGVIQPLALYQQLMQYKEKAILYSGKTISIQNTQNAWQVSLKANHPQGEVIEHWEIIPMDNRFYINYAHSPIAFIKK